MFIVAINICPLLGGLRLQWLLFLCFREIFHTGKLSLRSDNGELGLCLHLKSF